MAERLAADGEATRPKSPGFLLMERVQPTAQFPIPSCPSLPLTLRLHYPLYLQS